MGWSVNRPRPQRQNFSWMKIRVGPCGCAEASVITVGANPALVESQLVAGEIRCSCSAPVSRWGWARERGIHGLGRVRPRRGRCLGCGRTHVLMPVRLLARRAYSAQIIITALVLK